MTRPDRVTDMYSDTQRWLAAERLRRHSARLAVARQGRPRTDGLFVVRVPTLNESFEDLEARGRR